MTLANWTLNKFPPRLPQIVATLKIVSLYNPTVSSIVFGTFDKYPNICGNRWETNDPLPEIHFQRPVEISVKIGAGGMFRKWRISGRGSGRTSINSRKKRTIQEYSIWNGYSNTIRWDLSSQQPASISRSSTALSWKKRKVEKILVSFSPKRSIGTLIKNGNRGFADTHPSLILVNAVLQLGEPRGQRFAFFHRNASFVFRTLGLENVAAAISGTLFHRRRVSCSFREIVEGTTLLHVVVTNPHRRRRSAVRSILLCTLSNLSRNRCTFEGPTFHRTAHFVRVPVSLLNCLPLLKVTIDEAKTIKRDRQRKLFLIISILSD